MRKKKLIVIAAIIGCALLLVSVAGMVTLYKVGESRFDRLGSIYSQLLADQEAWANAQKAAKASEDGTQETVHVPSVFDYWD